MRHLVGLLAFGVLVVGLALPAQATTAVPGQVVDQQQPIIDTSVGGLAIGGFSQQIIAQTVTTGIPGLLEGVRLPLGCDPDATLTLQIQNLDNAGVPNGTVLTSETIPGTSLGGLVTGFRDFPLASPVNMSLGQHFAIVLSASSTLPGSGCGVLQGPVGDSYAGGDIYYQSLPNVLGHWICQCTFSGARLDLPFQTLVLGATFESLKALTNQFVSDAGIANSLTSKLAAAQSAADRGNEAAKAGALGAYAREVQAQTGKELTTAQADLLLELVRML